MTEDGHKLSASRYSSVIFQTRRQKASSSQEFHCTAKRNLVAYSQTAERKVAFLSKSVKKILIILIGLFAFL